nr:unnamed protein product [Digitaria exilis]
MALCRAARASRSGTGRGATDEPGPAEGLMTRVLQLAAGGSRTTGAGQREFSEVISRTIMANLKDIGLAAGLNILGAVLFLVAFAFLRLQPINDRVYFPKWYLEGARESPSHGGAFVRKFVNLDMRSYLKFLSWMPAALKMPEDELISHAGLDSAVYLRIYLVGLKIFSPIAILAFAVLVPVNWTNDTLKFSTLQHSNIDKLSISNIPVGSKRFIAHLTMAYVFTFWTCYVLLREYEIVAQMRLRFLASEKRRPDQFTVLVRNIPPDPDESIGELVEHFFLVNHPDHYLTHQVVYNANKLSKLVEEKTKMQNWLDYYQLKFERNASKRPTTKTGFLGCFGAKVDAIDYYKSEIERIENEVSHTEAMKKDTLERAREPGFDLKGYLMNAYVHPVFKGDDDDEKFSIADEPEAEQVLVATKRQSRRNTPVPSKYNGSDSPSLPEIVNDQRL